MHFGSSTRGFVSYLVTASAERKGRGRRKRTHTVGTSPAAYFTLNVHVSRRMRALIAARAWLTVIRLPACAPDLNPTESVWSWTKRGITNIAVRGVDHLTDIVEQRLRACQQQTDLLASFLAQTGMTPEPEPP
jgi:transposase